MRNMLTEKEWNRNVGTDSWPVSFLHEYAVGLIWDMLHTSDGPIRLPTINGSPVEDVKSGIDKVIIPDALQAVAGYIPDISLLMDSRPVRCIEVIVSNALAPSKVTAMHNLGVEVIQVPVRNEGELRCLFPAIKSPNWWPKFSRHEEVFESAARKSGVNWQGTRQYKILARQEKADEDLDQLMLNLATCSPEMRRRFAYQLHEMMNLESLYPLRQENPKFQSLQS